LRQIILKLKTKLQIALLLVATLCIMLTGWQSFEYSRSAIEAITFARLTGVRETKKQHIESYFAQIRNHLISLAEDRTTITATEELTAAFASLRSHNLSDSLRSVIGLVRSGDPSSGHPALAPYARAFRSYHPMFQTYARRFRYSDILLADAATGDVIYTVAGRDDGGSSLHARESNLARAFDAAMDSGEGSLPCLVDFAPYAVTDSLPAAFIASPVFNGGEKIGVLLFELSIRDINDVMTSGTRWEEEGLGKTGETYIVGDDFKMRNDSRFFVQDSSSYFSHLRQVGLDESTLNLIRTRSTSILLQNAMTEASKDALAGRTDTRIINDYRGIPVLSSYTPLNIPGVRWVMLAEIDAREALAPVAALRERLIFAGLVLLLLASVVGFVLARMISSPLIALTAATERLGKGKPFTYPPETSGDEIGVLARAFKGMVEGMTRNTELLHQEINERKRAETELMASREELRSLSSHLQSVREEERQGVAREIHDELGQALSSLKLDLALMKEELHQTPQEAERRVTSMSEVCDTTIKAVRRIITQLRPRLLDDLGLTAAIEWQADEFQHRTGIVCALDIVPEEITLDEARSTAIFRIFQETLTNVARHSGATKVAVRFRLDDSGVRLHVSDNGKGIPENQIHDSRSFGLLGIRERAHYWGGSVTITGSPMKGTSVEAFFPGQFRGAQS
jgi:signal transduction histidine kinase